VVFVGILERMCDSRRPATRSGVSSDAGLEARVVGLEQQMALVRKLLDEEFAERVKDVEDRVVRVESRLAVCFGDGNVIKDSVLTEKVREVVEEVDSKVAVCDLRFEERIGAVSKKVSELGDRVMAFELQVKDLQEFPTPAEGEWQTKRSKHYKAAGRPSAGVVTPVGVALSVGESGGESGAAGVSRGDSRISFAEKVEAKGKGKVYLLGDSLVRGVGKKLEAQCSNVFSAKSIGGARIEAVTEEVRKLEARDDRHLVVMVGANNIQQDGSELVLRKFQVLIDCCHKVKNRAVTVVGISRRFDLTSLQENRRVSVNRRLSVLCREAGVQYVEYEAGRSMISADRVHFNETGQREVAGMIFRHCRHFLV
jgi:hypothetical protein